MRLYTIFKFVDINSHGGVSDYYNKDNSDRTFPSPITMFLLIRKNIEARLVESFIMENNGKQSG